MAHVSFCSSPQNEYESGVYNMLLAIWFKMSVETTVEDMVGAECLTKTRIRSNNMSLQM
jgi:hypothetical protein